MEKNFEIGGYEIVANGTEFRSLSSYIQEIERIEKVLKSGWIQEAELNKKGMSIAGELRDLQEKMNALTREAVEVKEEIIKASQDGIISPAERVAIDGEMADVEKALGQVEASEAELYKALEVFDVDISVFAVTPETSQFAASDLPFEDLVQSLA